MPVVYMKYEQRVKLVEIIKKPIITPSNAYHITICTYYKYDKRPTCICVALNVQKYHYASDRNALWPQHTGPFYEGSESWSEYHRDLPQMYYGL